MLTINHPNVDSAKKESRLSHNANVIYVSPEIQALSINIEISLLHDSGGAGGLVPNPVDGGDD